MSSLIEAMEALNRRKIAASDAKRGLIDVDQLRLIFVGTDIDLDEIQEMSAQYAMLVLNEMAKEQDQIVCVTPEFVQSMAGVWIDGILTGLLLGDLRAKEDGGSSFPNAHPPDEPYLSRTNRRRWFRRNATR